MNGTLIRIDGPRGVVWRLFVEGGRDGRGRRVRITKRVRGTKGEAQRALRELVHQVETGEYVRPTRLTVAGYLEGEWLPAYRLTVRPTTFDVAAQFARRYIIPGIGGVRLSELSRERVQALYAGLLSGGGRGGVPLAAATVRKVHQILRRAIGTAVRWELAARNVVDLVEAPGADRRTVRVLEPFEIDSLLGELEGSSPWAVAPAMLAFHSGLRRSEILGLRWTDIDLDRGTISVRRAYHRLDDGSTGTRAPKSRRGSRLLPLTRSSLEMLRDARARSEKRAAMLGRTLGSGEFVFARLDGEPYRPDSLTSAFRRAARRTGLPGARFHDTRHTHASLLLRAGVHPKVVSERLGHASVAFTLDVYSHVMPGLQEAAAESLERALNPAGAARRPALPPAPGGAPARS
jgi:integrase